MVKCLPEFEYFYCVLKNKNIIFKIRRSKVTDYAALKIDAESFRSLPIIVTITNTVIHSLALKQLYKINQACLYKLYVR